MSLILLGVTSLLQYLAILKHGSISSHPKYCPHCGKGGLCRHGCYFRKADRSGNQAESLNPIPIQRYCCPSCRRTCSVLPECLPPHRWYLWEVQQLALMLVARGTSLYAAAKEIMPSRRTIGRWIARFKDQFHFHKDVLCGHYNDLGRNIDMSDFWQACMNIITLAQAMRLCHVAGVLVP